MARDITEKQYRALEAEHGAGRIVVLCAGDEEFAFKRLGMKEARELVEREAEGAKDTGEFAMLRALLCPAAPAAGKGIAAERKLPKEDREAMLGERAALDKLIAQVPVMGDMLGRSLAAYSGGSCDIDLGQGIEGVYQIAVKLEDGRGGALPDQEPIVVEARKPSREVYSVYREKSGNAWEAAAFLFDRCCKGNDDLRERFPLLAYYLGSRMLPGLGYEEVQIRPKRFGASGSTTPASSTNAQSPET